MAEGGRTFLSGTDGDGTIIALKYRGVRHAAERWKCASIRCGGRWSFYVGVGGDVVPLLSESVGNRGEGHAFVGVGGDCCAFLPVL